MRTPTAVKNTLEANSLVLLLLSNVPERSRTGVLMVFSPLEHQKQLEQMDHRNRHLAISQFQNSLIILETQFSKSLLGRLYISLLSP